MEKKPNNMKPRWRKVLSDLWDNKVRTILVVASIAVGVFAVGTIANAFVIISEDISVGYSAANPANLEIFTDSFQEDLTRSIEKMPNVASAEGRHIFTGRISNDGGKTWLAVDLISMEDFENNVIYKRVNVEGESVPGTRDIIIEKLVLDEMDISVGQVLHVQLPDGTIKEMIASGITQDQEALPIDFTSLPQAYVSMNALTWLGEHQDFNRLFVTFDTE